MSGGVSDAARRPAAAVGPAAAAAGRRDGPAGVRAGPRGHRTEPPHAVSRSVPEQTRIPGFLRGIFR